MRTPRMAHSSNNEAQHRWQAAPALLNVAEDRAQGFASK
jgi:hypothetical protein